MLLDTKAKTPSITEVLAQQLVFLDLQSTLQQLHCFVTSHSNIASYLLITPDSKRSYSIPCCQGKKNILQQLIRLFGLKLQVFETVTNQI